MGAVRILVCDDHDLIRAMLARLLCDEGHDVTEAGGVAEALDALAGTPHDAIVLDLHLGGESGLAVVDGLRAPIPVILVSGDFADASPEEAARFGVAAVLPKPFEPEQLLDVLARVTGAAI
jgi:CheY-like chemotaxis protein